MHLVQQQAGVQESLGLVPAECNQSTTSITLSDWIACFHRWLRLYSVKPAQIQFGTGWLCQVLAKWIWSWSKPVCMNHRAPFWPMLLSWSGSDVNWIQHVYWACAGQQRQVNRAPAQHLSVLYTVEAGHSTMLLNACHSRVTKHAEPHHISIMYDTVACDQRNMGANWNER